MTHPAPDDELLHRYLREDLSEDEEDALERRLLVEDDLFELLEALEAELLAAAGRGELPAAEREWVLRRLASSPRGRKRLALARSLNTLADEFPESLAPVIPISHSFSRPRLVWPGLAAAASLLLAIGLWHARPPAPLPLPPPPPKGVPVPTPTPPAPTEETTPPVPVPVGDHDSRPRPQPITAVFTLSLATTRGAEEIAKFPVPPETDIVEIQMDLEGLEDFKSFHVAVQRPGKEPIWEKAGLRPRRLKWGPALVLKIPASQLPEARYQVVVKPYGDIEEVTQDFDVVQKKQ